MSIIFSSPNCRSLGSADLTIFGLHGVDVSACWASPVLSLAEHISLVSKLLIVVLDFWKSSFNLVYDLAEMRLDCASQIINILLVSEEAFSQVNLALVVYFKVELPVFFVSLVQFLQRRFEICLNEVEEHLLRYAFQVESHGVSEGECSPRSYDELRYLFEE